jgi:succinate dehydrogenase/fumarate reductase flavoprotein subunit
VVSAPTESAAAFTFERGKETLQEAMSTFVGMSRSSGSLGEAAHILGGLCRLIDVSLSRPPELELQNLVTTATLLTHAAWVREESRGTHRRTDFPERDDESWGGHVVWVRGSAPRLARADARGDEADDSAAPERDGDTAGSEPRDGGD